MVLGLVAVETSVVVVVIYDVAMVTIQDWGCSDSKVCVVQHSMVAVVAMQRLALVAAAAAVVVAAAVVAAVVVAAVVVAVGVICYLDWTC